VSTRITSALAARHGHDLVRAQSLSGVAAKPGKPIRSGLFLDLDEDDPAILATLEIDHTPWPDPEEFADLLWDRDLALMRVRPASSAQALLHEVSTRVE
jgi:hypothetical protein